MKPIVIAHRGASGYLPEHTLTGYFVAIQQGADYIEPDLVMTRDGVPVARHENAIAILNADGTVREATTDVAEHVEFAARLSTRSIDGHVLTGWFTEDFTLAELKTLRCRERLPGLRPGNTRFDGQFEIPTLEEILNLVDAVNQARARDASAQGRLAPQPIGIYPETKHPGYFRGIGLPIEDTLVDALHRHGYRDRQAPIFIQSFEVSNLQALRGMTALPLIQLMDAAGNPWDFAVNHDPRNYAAMATPAGLAEIAAYADGIGVNKEMMMPRNAGGSLDTPTSLVTDAHQAGLLVHGWTFRAESHFLPANFQSGAGPAAFGQLADELRAYLALGMDGFFTDQTDIGVRARDAVVSARQV
jgi:glycerophosphoryl diester phosphodiesterase